MLLDVKQLSKLNNLTIQKDLRFWYQDLYEAYQQSF